MSTRPESEQEAAPTSEPPRGFRRSLRHIGPGIIVSGSIVGSGELIVTTKLGAEVGFILLWLILFSCFIKVFLQIEFGRQVIATGATTLQALDRIPGPRVGFRLFGMRCQGNWLVWLWAAMALCSVFQLGGILLGLVQVFDLEALNLGGVPTQVWLGATVSVSVGILVTGRYRHIERTATWMVFLFTGITILTLLLLQGSPEYAVSTAELGSGLSLSFPDEGLLTGLAVLGITGVGASELIFYPYWCLEKGYARHVGPPDGSVEWTRRARGWIRVMRIDVWVSFAVYTTATVAFYLLGASTLHRRGLVPDDDELHQSLSYMYTAGFGEAAGSWVYLLGAIAVLFSTFFVAMASNSRVFADAFSVFRIVQYRDERQRMRTVRLFCVVLPLFCWLTVTLFGSPVTLILVGALAQATLLPFIAFAALYFRYRCTPRELAGRRWEDMFLWLAFLAMVAVGVYQLYDRLLAAPG